jgi:hypothetical protein
MEHRRAAASAFLQRQLHIVAINARGQASADPPAFPSLAGEPEKKRAREEPEAEVEEIMAGQTVVTVPAGLSALTAAQFRSLLLEGWSKLPHSSRSALNALLPEGVKAEQLLSKDAPLAALFGSPVDQFFRRFQLGLMHPPVVALRARLPELARRVSDMQVQAVEASTLAERAAFKEGQWMMRGDKQGHLQWREPEDLSSGESELGALVRSAARPRQPKARRIQPQKRRDTVAASPNVGSGAGEVLLGSGGGIVLDAQQQVSMTRAEKKTRSRIVNGVFLSAFNMLIKARELLRAKSMPGNEFAMALSQDPAVSNDGVEGMSPLQLARVAIAFLQRMTRCHKTDFGPYVAGEAARLHWIDDADYDEFEVLLELESAERLLRYGLSRGVVDFPTGSISHTSIKELKNNPVTVARMPPDQLREFHRQEALRYENAGQPFCYRLAGLNPFCVAPQRGKTLVKIARRHAMLLDERPSTVTLQDVVRDALARLPQGVGTKADLQVVVMDSQFVNQDVTAAVLSSAISDSLDRLSAVSDPAASFHAMSRLWSYLHRNRAAHEFVSAGDDE